MFNAEIAIFDELDAGVLANEPGVGVEHLANIEELS